MNFAVILADIRIYMICTPVFQIPQEKNNQHWILPHSSAHLPVGKTVWHHYFILLLHFLISLSRNSIQFWCFSSPHNIQQLIWKEILTSKFIYVWIFCPSSHLWPISLWSVNFNQFDQVSALCTAWGWQMWRGGWLVEKWVDNCWSQCGEGCEVRGQGG